MLICSSPPRSLSAVPAAPHRPVPQSSAPPGRAGPSPAPQPRSTGPGAGAEPGRGRAGPGPGQGRARGSPRPARLRRGSPRPPPPALAPVPAAPDAGAATGAAPAPPRAGTGEAKGKRRERGRERGGHSRPSQARPPPRLLLRPGCLSIPGSDSAGRAFGGNPAHGGTARASIHPSIPCWEGSCRARERGPLPPEGRAVPLAFSRRGGCFVVP